MTNKQLKGEYSMGLKWKVVEACRIFEEAKEMYIVSCRRGNQSSGRTGDLEEQCFGAFHTAPYPRGRMVDLEVRMRRGAANAVCAMIRIQEEYEIKTEAEAFRASNN